MNEQQMAAAIAKLPRDNDWSSGEQKPGKLSAFAWPGGSPIIYLTPMNDVLCAECAQKALDDPDEYPENKPVYADVYYEGPAIECDGLCGKMIESAYGDPEDEDETR
jgi:hypothetical protein